MQSWIHVHPPPPPRTHIIIELKLPYTQRGFILNLINKSIDMKLMSSYFDNKVEQKYLSGSSFSEDFLLFSLSYHCGLNVLCCKTSSMKMDLDGYFFNYCSDISIDKHLYMLWSFQLSTAALCLLLPCFSVCECPFKALHHPLCSFFFFSLSTFLSVQPFLPRDNWLIHQCITPPPPDPQCHGCLRSSRHTFQGHV